MKKLKELCDLYVPYLWAACWVIIITVGSFGLAVSMVKWLLRVLGVM